MFPGDLRCCWQFLNKHIVHVRLACWLDVSQVLAIRAELQDYKCVAAAAAAAAMVAKVSIGGSQLACCRFPCFSCAYQAPDPLSLHHDNHGPIKNHHFSAQLLTLLADEHQDPSHDRHASTY